MNENLGQKSIFWSASTIIVTQIIYFLGFLLLLFVLGVFLGDFNPSLSQSTFAIIVDLIRILILLSGAFMGIRYIKKKTLITSKAANKIALSVLVVNLVLQLIFSDLSIIAIIYDIAIFFMIKNLSVNSKEAFPSSQVQA